MTKIRNNKLIYFTKVQETFSNFSDDAESELSDADTGENYPAKDAKQEAIEFIDQRIEELKELRDEIKNDSVATFMENHGYEYEEN